MSDALSALNKSKHMKLFKHPSGYNQIININQECTYYINPPILLSILHDPLISRFDSPYFVHIYIYFFHRYYYSLIFFHNQFSSSHFFAIIFDILSHLFIKIARKGTHQFHIFLLQCQFFTSLLTSSD